MFIYQKKKINQNKFQIFRNDTPTFIGFFLIFLSLCGVCLFLCKFQTAHATGRSMNPTIQDRDFLVIYKTQDVHINDIVAFEFDSFLITHRYVSKYNTTHFIALGDNNSWVEIVPYTNIIGKVIFHSNPTFLFILLPIFIILLLFVFTRRTD